MIQRGPYPPLSIPAVALAEFVLDRPRRLGGKPAFVDAHSNRTVTHAQFVEGVERASSGFVRRGLEKGEVVALIAPNSVDCPIVFHAIVRAGGIITPIPPLASPDDITKQLKDSGARFVVAAAELAPRVAEAARGIGLEEIFTLGATTDFTPFASLAADSGSARMPAIDPQTDVAALPYSSGTTGLSKGVMLTHTNLVANVLQLDVGHMRSDDTLVCLLPLSHIYGITAIQNMALALGATTVVMGRFDLPALVDVLVRQRITYAPLVPPILLEIAKNAIFAGLDLRHVRVVFSGAAPLSAEVSRAVAERIGCAVLQGYGMTEAGPATHMTPAPPHPVKHGSVGLPLANTAVRLVDTSDGREVDPGADGEVLVRGPQVMKGYWNNPGATRATVDDDGWLHTGDIGRVDEDGNLFVVDRVKELIKYKGWQVAPAELEALLVTHPAIADAAVVGVDDGECGELPKAFVVRRADITADEIMAFVAERVAPYKKLRLLSFVERIPKSPSGKILRRVLRDGPG
ncbi:MAG: AMP-binding protein [Planctomycetes bacterium]|nr:AMP-binding protein [Planctomycetota bacterium]